MVFVFSLGSYGSNHAPKVKLPSQTQVESPVFSLSLMIVLFADFLQVDSFRSSVSSRCTFDWS